MRNKNYLQFLKEILLWIGSLLSMFGFPELLLCRVPVHGTYLKQAI